MSFGCEFFRRQILREAGEGLSGEEERQLARHLKECPDCRRERNACQDVVQELRLLIDEEVPHHFLVEEARRPQWVGDLWRLLSYSGRLALFLLLLLTGAVLAGFQIRVDSRSLQLSWGHAADPSGQVAPQLPLLMQEEMKQVRLQLQGEQEELWQVFRAQQEALLKWELQQMEARLGELISEQDRQRREQFQRELGGLLALTLRQQEDLQLLGRRLEELQVYTRMKETQTSLALSALWQAAGLHQGR